MLNDLKRTLLSIKEHKKDSILIFIIVLILTSFMMIYWIFYLSANQMSKTIKDNVKININISGGFIENQKSEEISLYLTQNELDYDFYLKHIKTIQNIYDEILTYEGVNSTSSIMQMPIDNNINSTYKYIYSYNQDVFDNDNYKIVEGKTFDENYDKGILVNSVISKDNGDGTYIELQLDDLVSFTNSQGEVFTYKIIGFFNHQSTNNIMIDDLMYDLYETSFILPTDELYKMTTLNNTLYITVPTIKVTGVSNADTLETYLKSSLKKLKFEKSKAKNMEDQSAPVSFENYALTIDDSLSKQLEKPIDNIKFLFQIISIFMIVIMFVLLSSFILCVLNSRIHDFGIFIALGQSKLKLIFNFIIEIFIIAILAFLLSIPVSLKLTSFISESMISSNLKRQERIAIISENQDNIDIFKTTEEAYKDYKLTLDAKDYLYVFGITSLIIIISQASVLVVITSIKPKQLLIK